MSAHLVRTAPLALIAMAFFVSQLDAKETIGHKHFIDASEPIER